MRQGELVLQLLGEAEVTGVHRALAAEITLCVQVEQEPHHVLGDGFHASFLVDVDPLDFGSQ